MQNLQTIPTAFKFCLLFFCLYVRRPIHHQAFLYIPDLNTLSVTGSQTIVPNKWYLAIYWDKVPGSMCGMGKNVILLAPAIIFLLHHGAYQTPLMNEAGMLCYHSHYWSVLIDQVVSPSYRLVIYPQDVSLKSRIISHFPSCHTWLPQHLALVS